MKKFVFSMFLIAVIMTLTCCTLHAENSKFLNGVAQINAYTKNKTLVKVIVSTVKYSPQITYHEGYMWGADEYDKPKFLIKNINISVGKEKVFVPLSAYCGLANPSEIKLKISNNNSFSLFIRGGDAAGSYEGELVFANLKIKTKKIVHGEFPDELWEKTEYSFVQDRGQ